MTKQRGFLDISILLIILVVVVVGVLAYAWVYLSSMNQNPTLQSTALGTITASTTTTTTTTSTRDVQIASPSSTSITWQDGKLSYAITGASGGAMGVADCATGHFPCPQPGILYLNVKVTNNDAVGRPTSSIPLHINQINEKGNLTAPATVKFPNDNAVIQPGETSNINVGFLGIVGQTYAFTTGGSSAIFFLATVSSAGNLQKTNCTFPTTSSTCLAEIQ